MNEDDMRIVGTPFLVRDQAVVRLRTAIVTGHYRPGARLIERELCDLLGVSRTSVREALRQLEAERLVTVRPRSGPEVTSIGPKEATELYEMRTILEGMAVRLFVERASDKDVARLTRLSDTFARAATKGDMPRMIAVMSDFYDCIFAGTDNEVMHGYCRQLCARVDFLRFTSMSQPGRSEESVREIGAIVAAIALRDADAAQRVATEHIRNAAATALRVLALVNGGARGLAPN